MQIQQSPWNKNTNQNVITQDTFIKNLKNDILPCCPRFVIPLWRAPRRTEQYTDSRYSSSPRRDPSTVAFAPFHPQWNESSEGKKIAQTHIAFSNVNLFYDAGHIFEIGLSQEEYLTISGSHLDCHNLASGFVDHLIDGAVRPAADLPEVSQVLSREVAVLLRRNLQLPWRFNAVRPQPLSMGPWGWDRRDETRRNRLAEEVTN